MKYAKIGFDDKSQHESLKETKEHHGLMWKRMVLHAHRELDSESED